MAVYIYARSRLAKISRDCDKTVLGDARVTLMVAVGVKEWTACTAALGQSPPPSQAMFPA